MTWIRACGMVMILSGWTSLAAQPLRLMGDRQGICIGSAVDPSRFSDGAYVTTLAREFSQVEPENAMKFGPIHPQPGTYNFGPADAIVSFAQTNHMVVRGHTLVWYQQNPSWVTSGNSPAQLTAILQDHIRTVVGRYAGQVYAWDVVNEAFNDDGTLRQTLWAAAFGGAGYIEQAFQRAHAADPGARLFYNDYSADATNPKSDAIYQMARDFKARGVPIDGIGLQMHLTTSIGSPASMESNLRRLTELGLEVQITELDVRLPVDSFGNASDADLAAQARIYHDVTALCLRFSNCTAIQTWGFTDKYSWIPGVFTGYGAGLPFDAAYQAKPAYEAMQTAFLPPARGGRRSCLGSATGAGNGLER